MESYSVSSIVSSPALCRVCRWTAWDKMRLYGKIYSGKHKYGKQFLIHVVSDSNLEKIQYNRASMNEKVRCVQRCLI